MTLNEMKLYRNAIADTLTGCFWTDANEMVQEIEELLNENEIPAYIDFVASDEYITIAVEGEDEDVIYIAYIGHANSTRWVEDVWVGSVSRKEA